MRPAFSIYKPDNYSYSGGFEQLLRQEKTLYTVSDHKEDLPVSCFERVFPEWAYDYVVEGGIAIVSGADKNTFDFDSSFLCKANVEYIDLSEFDQEKARVCSMISVFGGTGKGELTLHENRNIKNNRRPGFYPVFLNKKLGKGTIIYTGVPMSELLTCEGSDLRKTSDVLDFDERIASIDKQKIASALRIILKEAMNMAGYPYLTLWYYPNGAKNIFAYSIDGDGLLTEGVNNLIEVSEKTNTKFVFYINKELCGSDPELKEKLIRISQNNIIASHGAIHNAHDSYEDNLKDIREHEEWMNSIGVPFEKSYASPRGMYCQNLGRALKDSGFRHSRDFGYAIDDYPYYPLNEGVDEVPLQIPCDGFNVCRWMTKNEESGLAMPKAEEIIESYKKQIDLKIERKLPLLFFCHPQYFGLYSKEVYPEIVSYAISKGALPTDYVSYGDFWISRDKCEYDANYTDGKLEITKNKWSNEMRICVDGVIQNN